MSAVQKQTVPSAEAMSRSGRGLVAVGQLVSRVGPFLGLVVILLAGWEAIVRLLDVPRYTLPPPMEVVTALVNGVTSGVLVTHTWVTLQEVLLGFGLAILFATVIAAVVTRWELIERAFMPLIVALQAVPKVALAPLLLTWFGFGMTSKVVTTALLAFFPLLINLIAGIQSADRDRMEMFRGLGATKWQTFRMLQMPAALPYFFAGLKIALTFSIIGAIVAEFVGAQAGLGYMIQLSSTNLNVATTFAVLVILSAIGMTLTSLIGWLGAKVVFWQGKGLDAISGS
ncbi:ABC transporter permease [Phytoactinopolyspora endophytica]|uniref:ABC transporter permease n=1 Tax=Phytoactinopolyspora endophytica TaxID=1642495 RepID=UPI00197B0B25|nr:ABC transporter permease [Phytoactinopolyspora endophytica]